MVGKPRISPVFLNSFNTFLMKHEHSGKILFIWTYDGEPVWVGMGMTWHVSVWDRAFDNDNTPK